MTSKDEEIRFECLKLAVGKASPGSSASQILEVAKEFYNFLKPGQKQERPKT